MTMTESDAAFDVERAAAATGLLATFNAAGVLSSADVHVAARLGRLGGEQDERVLLAAGLTVRSVRTGSVCLELAVAAGSVTGDEELALDVTGLPWPEPAEWQAACAASPLVATGVDGDPRRPLRLVQGLLYLDRYWRQERLVRTELDMRTCRAVPGVTERSVRDALQRLFPSQQPDRQRLAAASAALRQVTVIAGGPGTGKTTTIARVLAVLHALPGPSPRIALAAPTGKAAARLQQAVRQEAARLPEGDRARLGEPTASTVHRLLGWRPGSTSRFRHDRNHRLPQDVIVIDETSMVSLTLMSRLLEAVRPDARLMLVGDPDQLASVEAGAVLGDLVARHPATTHVPPALQAIAETDLPETPADRAAFRAGVVRLETVHRFGPAISALAQAVRAGDADTTVALLRAGSPAIEFDEVDVRLRAAAPAGLRDDAVASGHAVMRAATRGNASGALLALESHRLLCAHRRGPYGVARWDADVQRWLAEAGLSDQDAGEWYLGRPLLVTRNDEEVSLYNGDAGVVIAGDGEFPLAAFGQPEDPRLLAPSRLGEVQTVHAMTVHRAQGSQFARVSVVLPPPESPLLTRELFYTAVTRARKFVRVIGTEDAVRGAVQRRVRRASGLQRTFAAEGPSVTGG